MAYHTTSRIPTGETSYSLVYEIEAVILVEIGKSTFQIANFNEKTNEREQRLNLDLLGKKKERAQICQAAHKQ